MKKHKSKDDIWCISVLEPEINYCAEVWTGALKIGLINLFAWEFFRGHK